MDTTEIYNYNYSTLDFSQRGSLCLLTSLSSRCIYIYTAALLCRMSQRKMLQFSTGALLLLLHWFGGLVLGEVDKDFSSCLDFFHDRTPPQGINEAGYQPICQRHKNQYHFASLYNRQHRAPLYSAYTLGPADGKRPDSTWMYEPQVRTKTMFAAHEQPLPFKIKDVCSVLLVKMC